jgi:hypothetical protein
MLEFFKRRFVKAKISIPNAVMTFPVRMPTTLPLSTAGSVLTSTAYSGTWIAAKRNCYVLAGDRTSFDMFLALGLYYEEKKDTNFVFVEKIEDFSEDYIPSSVRLLDDFFINICKYVVKINY